MNTYRLLIVVFNRNTRTRAQLVLKELIMQVGKPRWCLLCRSLAAFSAPHLKQQTRPRRAGCVACREAVLARHNAAALLDCRNNGVCGGVAAAWWRDAAPTKCWSAWERAWRRLQTTSATARRPQPHQMRWERPGEPVGGRFLVRRPVGCHNRPFGDDRRPPDPFTGQGL